MTKLRMCSRCLRVRYCGEQCSVAHHQEHKEECKRIAAERRAAGR